VCSSDNALSLTEQAGEQLDQVDQVGDQVDQVDQVGDQLAGALKRLSQGGSGSTVEVKATLGTPDNLSPARVAEHSAEREERRKGGMERGHCFDCDK
jgi:hypothetical protein